MTGFATNGRKKLIVKFNIDYNKNCIELHEPSKFYNQKPLPVYSFAKGLVQIRGQKKFTAIQNFRVGPIFFTFEGFLWIKISVLNCSASR